jgi:two-component system CheB/CheR fusion protein
MHNDSLAADDVLTAAERTAVAGILALVRQRTGLDLCPYRPATILRRIRNRMISVGTATLAEYLDVLQANAGETAPLVDRLTIKVSRFYRNRDTFDTLRSDVLPSVAVMRAGAPLRIWSAGCGFGEEAYTLAMLLAEGGWPGAVDATDIDATALARASEAVYSAPALEELPRDLADRYLVPVASAPPPAWRVADEIRARVRFSRHDLVAGGQPAHAGAYELVSCRNVLIYLQRAAQDQALGVLRRALVPGGVLCLGEAEWPSPAAAEGLAVVSRRARIFRAAESSG